MVRHEPWVRNRVIRLMRDGMSYRSVAVHSGVSPATVWRWWRSEPSRPRRTPGRRRFH